jgi:hypothetical protein
MLALSLIMSFFQHEADLFKPSLFSAFKLFFGSNPN